ncbi:MAG: hypothetical protein ACK4F7_04325, partial [Inhella sp.]
GLEPAELLPVHLSPPQTRRRAGLHGLRTAKGAVLGYREGGSHRVVDLAECPVLHPALAALIVPLRKFVAAHGPKGMVGIDLTLADQGVEASLSQFPLDGLGPTEAALDFAREQGLARLSFDQGYGPETVWEPEPVTVTLAGVPVGLPPGAFLQATRDAEQRMAADAAEWLGEARIVADLFAGLGTFAFALREGRKVFAVEAERAAHLACKSAGAQAGGQVLALHRYRPQAYAGEVLLLRTSGLARWQRWLFGPWRRWLRLREHEVQGLHGSVFEPGRVSGLAQCICQALGLAPSDTSP